VGNHRNQALKLAVLTSGRQDWGAVRSICLRLRDDSAFKLQLLVGGMHCSERFGNTAQLVEDAGFHGYESLAWIPDNRLPSASEQSGEALKMIARSLDKQKSHALLIVGDRFETAAAALAATVASIPVIHISGGEETEGAFDNQLRHAITKMSHLHLVGNEDAAARIKAMGEDPATVHVVGDPLLDNLHRSDLASRADLEDFVGGPLLRPVVLVTLHPATLGVCPEVECSALIQAMDEVDATYIITQPNSDPGHETIRTMFTAAARKPRRYFVPALGDRLYWGLLCCADAMIGNSSSGLIEAPAVQLPVVNLGDRQKSRVRGKNVLDVPPEPKQIIETLRLAMSAKFRASLNGTLSPYGDGHSAERIVKIFERWTVPCPPRKTPVRIAYA
jgi:UDP-hydrolysing UDP-N-acetyl-D-glucosamine 2-epimerase